MKQILAVLIAMTLVMSTAMPGVLAKRDGITGNAVMTQAQENETLSESLGKRLQTAREQLQQGKRIVSEEVANLSRNIVQTKERLLQKAQVQTQEIREYVRGKLVLAVDKCQELGFPPEQCEMKLQKRLDLVDKLSEQDMNRLGNIEAAKERATQRFGELANSTNFAKFQGALAKARNVTANMMNKARERFQNATDMFENASDQFENAKQNFLRTREQVQTECGTSNETEECQELQNQIREGSREYLENLLDMVLSQLEKAKSKVEGSEDISDAEANEALQTINERISMIEDLRTRVEAVTSETSKEDIQALAQDIKNVWEGSVKVALERVAGFVQTSKMGGVYVKLQQLEVKLQRTLAKMVEQGKDTTQVESLVSQFTAKLEEMRQLYETTQDNYRSAAALKGRERSEAIRTAQASMKGVNDGLKEAQRLLKDILKGIVQQTGSANLEEDESDEVLEDVEEGLECEVDTDCDENEVCQEGVCVKTEEPVEPEENETEPIEPEENETEPVEPEENETEPLNVTEPVNVTEPQNVTEPANVTEPTNVTEPVEPEQNETEPINVTEPGNASEPLNGTNQTN